MDDESKKNLIKEDSDELVAKNVTDFLNELWPKDLQHCPICKSDDWIVMDKIIDLNETHTKDKKQYTTYPVALVMCHNCGYTLHFNYILIKQRLEKNRMAVGEKNDH